MNDVSSKNVLEENKAPVSEFYELGLNQRDFDAAARYLGAYKQHNPLVEGGADGLQTRCTRGAKEASRHSFVIRTALGISPPGTIAIIFP